MHYGTHIDDAFMGDLRSDLLFTLFLADPAEYEGGELVMGMPQREQAFKLNAGDLVLYPRQPSIMSTLSCKVSGWRLLDGARVRS